jgi:ABC-type proline/glycine betaine transport system ATPase subunit
MLRAVDAPERLLPTRRLYRDFHGQEALDLVDRIVIINHGIIDKDGTAEGVFQRPGTNFVKDFVRFIE